MTVGSTLSFCQLISQTMLHLSLDVRASDINDAMKIASAKALAALVSDEELCAEYILPKAFDPHVKDAVAKAAAQAARERRGEDLKSGLFPSKSG